MISFCSVDEINRSLFASLVENKAENDQWMLKLTTRPRLRSNI